MEFLQLRYFADAAQTENFSQTAIKFSVPASAVSQSIRRLETELGAELFERKKNKVVLNEDGKNFYRVVRQMDALLSDAKKQLNDSTSPSSGEIRMQIFCNRRIVSDAIRAFHEACPGTTFILNHGFPSDEEFDLIISSDETLKERYACHPLLTEQIAVAFPKNHPLTQRSEITIHDLASEHFVTMYHHGNLYHLTQRLCAQAGFTPQISVECDDPYYLRKYIEMGLGIGFVPLFSWQGQFSDAIVCKPLGGQTRTTYAFWDPERYMTRTVSRFLQLLRQFCAQ